MSQHQPQTKNRRLQDDRRRSVDRRWHEPEYNNAVFVSDWPDQKMQFLLRYAFWVLGILYFNFIVGGVPIHWSVTQINIAYSIYIILHTLLFWHCHKYPYHPGRYRLAMWIDIVIVSITALNDPHEIPPTLLIYIMIVLGNGMRYGMKIFGEAMAGCVVAGAIVIASRYAMNSQVISVGLTFYIMFNITILLYAYVLMGKIDAGRLELEKNSKYDALTGLYNRRALLDAADIMFQRLKRHQEKFVMLFADLDGFKQVNDTHGHSEGDRALAAFAGIIRNSIRNIDIAARFGGDEFILLLDDTDMDEAERIATRIQKQLSLWAEEQQMSLSASFGIGEAPSHGRNFNTLLEQVDKALYCSKSGEHKGGCVLAKPPVLAATNA